MIGKQLSGTSSKQQLERNYSGAQNGHDDDDDEVIAEFDVVLAGQMRDDIHLLQYPLRPSYRPYGDQGELVKVEMAVTHQQAQNQQAAPKASEQPFLKQFDGLRLHYGLHKASPNYDENAVDHRIITHYLETQKVDTESQVQPNYCVCVLTDDNKLMLTPLTSFHQVRPSFDHVDKERSSRTLPSAVTQQQTQHQQMQHRPQGGAVLLKPREWAEVKYHEAGSVECDIEFEKLTKTGQATNVAARIAVDDEDEQMAYVNGDGLLWRVANRHEYQDIIAPFDDTEDFSTASLLKNKGTNLTLENLGKLAPMEMVKEILKKAGIVDYERLVRIFKEACHYSKQALPKESELIHALVTNLCLITEKEGLLIYKSQFQYDMQLQKRLASLRDYLILQLERNEGQFPLAQYLRETDSKFDEVKDIVNELSILKDGICWIRSYSETKFKARLSETLKRMAIENWAKFEQEVKRVQEFNFYKVEVNAIGMVMANLDPKTLLLKNLLIDEVTKFLMRALVSSYPLILKHLETIKALQAHLPLNEDLVQSVLQEITYSVNERIFLIQLENEDVTVMRNLVVYQFREKEYWRKADLKKAILAFLSEKNAEAPEKDINKAIQIYAMPYGSGMVQLRLP
ncbi:hypothetical protein FGO68_gene8998 [Halteria grandinella]|uniref:Uncharacterized protein n=1 Tax=Halteria grandinella TaxID=5974 RepID=A0A8J8T4M5_HALGN|nr:hypothetical protein FGO68_gene8998 [Halteria grandinella]